MPKRVAPAAERNGAVILEVLGPLLAPIRGTVLEVAAGTGQHAARFAAALPELLWQPTDLDPSALPSIDAWTEPIANVLPARHLDVREPPERWDVAKPEVMYAANLLHIAPWSAAEGLFRGAGALLHQGGALVTYGPYRIAGSHTAPSNARFDASLRSRDPSWGVRDLEALEDLAAHHGMRLERRVAMPANNFTLLWRREFGMARIHLPSIPE